MTTATDTDDVIDGVCYSIQQVTDELNDGGWKDCPELVDELDDYVKQLRKLTGES